MDITNLSAYTDYLHSAADPSKQAASKAAESITQESSAEELLDACKQFESYFLEQVFKEMEKTIPKDENTKDSALVDYFKDQAIQDVASKSTERNGLGLAEQLYEQMKRNYNIS